MALYPFFWCYRVRRGVVTDAVYGFFNPFTAVYKVRRILVFNLYIDVAC